MLINHFERIEITSITNSEVRAINIDNTITLIMTSVLCGGSMNSDRSYTCVC